MHNVLEMIRTVDRCINYLNGMLVYDEDTLIEELEDIRDFLEFGKDRIK